MHVYLVFDHAARNQLVLVTDLKKCGAQELTAAPASRLNCAEKIVASVSTLAVDFIFFTDKKNSS